ncbi:hypothetical protein [Paraburkholderia youngii]|uniref:hypothetical protein n=1 Tax=Paraburkholderia youngii TaxID=2782701 RepID=UPI003D261B95
MIEQKGARMQIEVVAAEPLQGGMELGLNGSFTFVAATLAARCGGMAEIRLGSAPECPIDECATGYEKNVRQHR